MTAKTAQLNVPVKTYEPGQRFFEQLALYGALSGDEEHFSWSELSDSKKRWYDSIESGLANHLRETIRVEYDLEIDKLCKIRDAAKDWVDLVENQNGPPETVRAYTKLKELLAKYFKHPTYTRPSPPPYLYTQEDIDLMRAQVEQEYASKKPGTIVVNNSSGNDGVYSALTSATFGRVRDVVRAMELGALTPKLINWKTVNDDMNYLLKALNLDE